MSFVFPWSSTHAARTRLRLLALFFVMALVSMSVVSAATLPSRAQNVSNDGSTVQSLTPKVAQDPNGNVHVVWDSKEDQRVVRYTKGTWNGTTYNFGATQVIGQAGTNNFATPNITVAPNGTVMAAWSNAGKVISYRTWNSQESGPNLSFAPATLGAGIWPSLEADTNNNYHIAWSGNFDVQYNQIAANGGIVNAASFGENVVSPPDLAVDSNNNTHIVWHITGQQSQYRARAAGAAGFQPIETLGPGVTPQIAADGQGNVHIVRSQDFNIQYCRRTLGTACVDQHTLSSGNDVNPSIGATRGGSVIVSFRDDFNKVLLYGAREGGTWQASTEVGGGITVDVAQRVYKARTSIVWSENFDIQHRFAQTSVSICGVQDVEVTAPVVTSAAATKIYLPSISKQPQPPACG